MSELEATGGEGTLLTPEPATTSTENWYGEYAETVEQKGWKEPTDVLKSYTELERNASGKIKMPDFSNPEQNAEEIRAFYQKTGCPENPEGYDVQLPEGGERFLDDESLALIRQSAWDSGTSKQALDVTINSVVGGMIERDMKTREAGLENLKQELGPKYDEEVAIAVRFSNEACSDDFRAHLESSGLGDHPVYIKEFIRLGKETMSDSLIKGGVGSSAEAGYEPRYKDSPEMYATGEDDESVKARDYFKNKGHKY